MADAVLLPLDCYFATVRYEARHAVVSHAAATFRAWSRVRWYSLPARPRARVPS